MKEACRLLSDTTTYTRLPIDPLPQFSKEAQTLVKQALNDDIINKAESFFLSREYYNTQIHKDSNNPPWSPHCSHNGECHQFISIYNDHFLQPLAQNLPTYIHDGIHFIDTLKAYTWEPTYQWVSLDVNLLYIWTPHAVGLRAVQHFLTQNPLTNSKQANFILDSTHFCLTHNYFLFDSKFYLQTQSTAMPTWPQGYGKTYISGIITLYPKHCLSGNVT